MDHVPWQSAEEVGVVGLRRGLQKVGVVAVVGGGGGGGVETSGGENLLPQHVMLHWHVAK